MSPHPPTLEVVPPTLLPARSGDAYVRAQLDPATTRLAVLLGGAAGWVAAEDDRERLSVVGDPGDAARLADAVLAGPAAPPTVTLPRSAAPLLARPLPRPVDWDWFWTAAAPPARCGETRVRWLGASEEDDIRALLSAASPRHSAVPGGSEVRRWCGVRLDGRLATVAAWVEYVPGVPHLASIATAPDLRGQGWGAAVTAWLTRALLPAYGWVTLGMYADNAAARAMYRGLGYADTHLFTSGHAR